MAPIERPLEMAQSDEIALPALRQVVQGRSGVRKDVTVAAQSCNTGERLMIIGRYTSPVNFPETGACFPPESDFPFLFGLRGLLASVAAVFRFFDVSDFAGVDFEDCSFFADEDSVVAALFLVDEGERVFSGGEPARFST